MQNNPLVSIIIPVYNVEKYLKKCIESVINQTYKNLEIILVDDGSSDNSGKICDEFAQKDNRIKVIHKTNGGQADARNKALDIMNGEWVSFVDSDDFVSPYYIENLLSLAKKTGVDIVSISFEINLSNFKESKIQDEKILSFDSIKFIKEMFYGKFKHFPPTKIYKKEIFKDLRFPKGKLYEDIFTITLAISKSDEIAFCNKKDYFYLQRPDSTTGANFKEKELDVFEILDELKKKFEHNEDIINSINFCIARIGIDFITKIYKFSKIDKKIVDKIDDIIFKTRIEFNSDMPKKDIIRIKLYKFLKLKKYIKFLKIYDKVKGVK
ncbi:hypothetical protein CYJ41_03695 [Campylobacter ureolyticus]|uniref:Glycosyltransferase 2-like domain-containing protein n=1 Tax=Campylobacter ureolyticus TaxID=827 RepID=A0A2I1NAS5_9BACT|nr:glycosyltransferase family 2 protein [Campylobacter ureolyticus]MCR8699417.1 glycosyltransferase [Campylobacter ureolyticus]PKZ29468.1 hypothetical protein CYJ41_03695 [Campylobacter ureolyticus]